MASAARNGRASSQRNQRRTRRWLVDASLSWFKTPAPHVQFPQFCGRTPLLVFLTALFSVLEPCVDIRQYSDAINPRLTMHPPLITPRTVRLRAVGETHVWKPGELVMFDDASSTKPGTHATGSASS